MGRDYEQGCNLRGRSLREGGINPKYKAKVLHYLPHYLKYMGVKAGHKLNNDLQGIGKFPNLINIFWLVSDQRNS